MLASTVAAGDWDGWSEGRATFYGDDNTGVTIHQGSCEYYKLDWHAGTGWDIAALSDQNPDYANSCGRCYEVSCRPATFNDGYGSQLDREGVCKDPSKSVVVRITDTCPCYYPDNAYSNKRWCCGDAYHMDLSQWAFEKLADISQGVMGIRYRQVQCPSQNTGAMAAAQAGSWGSSAMAAASSSSSDGSSSSWSASSSSSDGPSSSDGSSSSAWSSSSSSGSDGSWSGSSFQSSSSGSSSSSSSWSSSWSNGRKLLA
eukprot:jgi/Chrzof1/6565/Cz19g01080.t1